LINVGDHPLHIGIAFADAPVWAADIVDIGRRDAAFVDTGFLVALLNQRDNLHDRAAAHWRQATVLPYTTPLVVGETVRQLAKAKGVPQPWRVARVAEMRQMVVDQTRIVVCGTNRDLLHAAMRELDEMQHTIERLDLCDCLSMMVLDRLRHRRVFGFDSDFDVVGASLEP
jgi:predicted nucleic acid-binding protein